MNAFPIPLIFNKHTPFCNYLPRKRFKTIKRFSMKIVFIILFFLTTLFSVAQDNKEKQKKEEYKLSATIKTVRGQLKDKKYSNANDEVKKAVKDHEEARKSAHLYALQVQALHSLVLDENKKMYLNQKPDTSKYLNLIYSLYESALICDSLDVLPNAKGKVDIKYRDTNQQRILQFRKNLSTADKYFYQKKDLKNAYKFADLYLATKSAKIFDTPKGQQAISAEKDSVVHASLAVFLAYANNNNKGVTKYLSIAMNDTARLAQLLEVGANSYYALGDTAAAHELLFKGVQTYPTNNVFYMTLLKYFNARAEYDKALELVDTVLIHMPDDRNCLFLKAKELEYMKQYDKALCVLQQIVKTNAEDTEAYSNIGSINLILAREAYSKFNLKVTDQGYAKGKQEINNYYKSAMQALENCRKYAEKNTDLWLAGLRECYYKLNMGKELKQLEKIK